LISEKQSRVVLLGLIFQESAFYELEKGNFLNALKIIKNASDEFNKVEDENRKYYYLASIEDMNGGTYFKLERHEKAIEHSILGLHYSSLTPNSDKSLVLHTMAGLGKSYLMNKQLDSAYYYLSKVEESAKEPAHPDLQLEIYPYLAKYYLELEDFEKHAYYNDMYLELYNEKLSNQDKSVDKIASKLSTEKPDTNHWLTTVSVFLIVLLIVVLLWLRTIKRKELIRFKNTLRNFEIQTQEKINIILYKNNNTEQTELNIDESRLYSLNENKRVLRLIDLFMQKGEFPKNNNSISFYAKSLETTEEHLKYLLEIINENDFDSYINKLKIISIIDKIEKNPEYRKYRVDVLADEAGFSSKRKFATVFENITGFSPSKFISLWIAKDEKNEEN